MAREAATGSLTYRFILGNKVFYQERCSRPASSSETHSQEQVDSLGRGELWNQPLENSHELCKRVGKRTKLDNWHLMAEVQQFWLCYAPAEITFTFISNLSQTERIWLKLLRCGHNHTYSRTVNDYRVIHMLRLDSQRVIQKQTKLVKLFQSRLKLLDETRPTTLQTTEGPQRQVTVVKMTHYLVHRWKSWFLRLKLERFSVKGFMTFLQWRVGNKSVSTSIRSKVFCALSWQWLSCFCTSVTTYKDKRQSSNRGSVLVSDTSTKPILVRSERAKLLNSVSMEGKLLLVSFGKDRVSHSYEQTYRDTDLNKTSTRFLTEWNHIWLSDKV